MAFNALEIKRYFNAGIATVAVDSPTASEISITNQIAAQIAQPVGFDLFIWDSAHSLQKAEITTKKGQFSSLKKSPVASYKAQGHPVEALLKYIEAECISASNPHPTLFLLKDLYPFIAGASPNPALVRLAVDAWFAVKRSPNRVIILHDGLVTPRVFQDLVADAQNPLPNESETSSILDHRIKALQKSASLQGVNFPVQLNPTDQKRMVRALLGMTAEGMDDTIQLCATTKSRLDAGSIEVISDIKKAKFAAKGIEYAAAPDVQVQGLPVLNEWATTITALLEPEAQELYNIPFPKGALIVGVGGTGKTLSVKCFAKEWGLPVIVLDTGKLMTKELGGSESNLREAIRAAESMAPCILFIDEMDKMFNSGSSETDGGTSQRMFGYFLKWFQESLASVFVAATANRPWCFKPEILRRFTKIFYVDLPSVEAREQIWIVQLQRYKLTLSAEEIHQLALESANFTGDEIRKVAEHCASVAYAQRRPCQVTVGELLLQIKVKPAQFSTDTTELEELRAWARSGQATWAAVDPMIGGTTDENSDRLVSWSSNNATPLIPT